LRDLSDFAPLDYPTSGIRALCDFRLREMYQYRKPNILRFWNKLSVIPLCEFGSDLSDISALIIQPKKNKYCKKQSILGINFVKFYTKILHRSKL